MKQQTILLTGGSTGIGKATAEILMKQGHTIYSGSRRGGGNCSDSKSGGKIISVTMDVNDEIVVKETVRQIISNCDRLDIVICNAGNGIAGAIEDTSIEEARTQFETNFFGVLKTVQACLPVFRQQRYGKIIVTSSVMGIVPIPYQTFYSAVKSALIAFIQGLSLEVKCFGIQCCSVLPGDTKTDFTSARRMTVLSQSKSSPYYEKTKASINRMIHDEQHGVPPEVVAKSIARQVNRKRMNLIVIPGFNYKLICYLFNILPAKFRIWIVGLIY